MTDILTITLNPALDVATSCEQLQPSHKLRCGHAERFPGGGGINVARVVQRLGGDCLALYLAGGVVGGRLQNLVDAEGVPSRGDTKNTFSAYRFHDDDPLFFQQSLRLTCRCGEELNGKKLHDPPDTEYTTYTWIYQW